MKNLTYFPFERNRYFYGKLLTVDDFETEQKYHNDKRRLINRFLHGSGVVCGMNVVQVDDTTVSVEMGLALDFAGREIVVDSPVIKKLSMIEGYSSAADREDAGYYYLCIEYSENDREPVHSITGTDARSQSQEEYNKVAEGYHMFLTSQEPESESFRLTRFYNDIATIYWGNGVRIRQYVPRFVGTGGELELKVLVENMGQQQPISFKYDLELSCLHMAGARRMSVAFDEREVAEAAKRYELTYRLSAMDVKNETGALAVAPESFELRVGDRVVPTEVAGGNKLSVVPRSAKRALMNQYYRTAMEDIVKTTHQQSIYLAKIALIKAGPTYIIENIEPVPFGQFVFNGTLSAALNDIEIDEIDALKDSLREALERLDNTARSPVEHRVTGPMMASGSVVVELGIGGGENQRFLSETVTHGLGLGPVSIILGQAYNLGDDSEAVFGPADVFEESSAFDIPAIDLAAKVNPTAGTFVIGVKTRAVTTQRRLRVNWTAIKDPGRGRDEREARALRIKPDVPSVDVRGSVHFEPVFEGVAKGEVRWQVKEPQGGSINPNGIYTAPGQPGVFEIICESSTYPELRASTYVSVREGNQTK